MPRKESNRVYPLSPYPLWERLSPGSRSALRLAMSLNHHRKLVPPGQPADLMDFDADREMRKASRSEDHMRAT
jgi:hypothetical protein